MNERPNTRLEALEQIAALATLHKVSVREFADIMHASEESRNAYAPIKRLFAYLSGICLFSGISAYINMFWHEMNSFERVIITLGSGIALFIMAVVSLKDPRYYRAASPMFQMSAVLQATGLFVAIEEWGLIVDSQIMALCVFGYMFLQEGLTLHLTRSSTMLFFTLGFGALFFSTAFRLLGVSDTLNGIIIGLSLLLSSYGINKIRHSSMSGFWYLCGSLLFLGFSFDLLRDGPVEFLYLGITCFMIYISVLSHSRILMTVSVGAMLAYIAYFTVQHFVDSIGWPIALILLGLLFSGISAGALRLNRRFFTDNYVTRKIHNRST